MATGSLSGCQWQNSDLSQPQQLQAHLSILPENKPLFYLHPQPTDGSLVLYYYGDFPTLAADTDTNALSIAAPDLIIYAALTYAADFYLDERAEIFESKYTAFLAEIQEQANDQELNGSANTIAPAYAYGDD